ncbi:MAG TPA: hypothetical protein VML55_01500 [Planctomycetaceae bacterium]|nr:hypothetical protein [Planctomycetaceae bacterium]
MWHGSRREFLRTTALAAAAGGTALAWRPAGGHQSDEGGRDERRVRQDAAVTVLDPRTRVPLSFIIDDSTCLVNMGHFCMPQFAAAWPDREAYRRPWKNWPREIPDAFVREFGEWCAGHGVKGKYSIVPYPACVGWLDRDLPGWPRRELLDSLKLVRELLLPNWDIHPEMITHTRVIDLKTGRPFEEISAATMENSYPQSKQSVDELAAYLAYALRILKNCELPCEGITTPGGFGNMVKTELPLAVQQAVGDVYAAEIPHYFKYVAGGAESTEPKLEHVSGLARNVGRGSTPSEAGRAPTPSVGATSSTPSSPRLTVNVPAGTGDWFGGWDGDEPSQGRRYANDDATSGRMVELIERGQPALMLCHWPGMYTHGTKQGFEDFKRVVVALEGRFKDRTLWMKLSEIARYWAAKELTQIEKNGGTVTLTAPFACPDFTLRIAGRAAAAPRVSAGGQPQPLEEVTAASRLKSGTWLRERDAVVCCFGLVRGSTQVEIA